MASSAYNDSYAEAKMRLQTYPKQGTRDRTAIILDAFLNHLSQEGVQNMVDDILQCHSNPELKELADHLVSSLLLPVKSAGGRSRRPTPSPVLDADFRVEEAEELLHNPASRATQRRLKASCLRRDGYQCIVTGIYDPDAPRNVIPANIDYFTGFFPTDAAHIIPFNLATFSEDDGGQRRDKAMIWSCLYRCFPGLRDRIALSNPHDINQISNVMTLIEPVHRTMGDFNLALEATPQQNRYRVKKYGIGSGFALPARFATDPFINIVDHNSGYSLPDSYFIEMHYIITEILHASGMSEILDQILDEYYSTRA